MEIAVFDLKIISETLEGLVSKLKKFLRVRRT